MKVDIDTLKILDVIIEEGSFAKAAIKLHRTQSAVSYQIRKLEENLNVSVFDRSQYRAQLTPLGQSILREGRRLIQHAEHIEFLAERYHEDWEAHLELVIDGILPIEPIMQSLKMMADEQIPTNIRVKMEYLSGVHYRFEKDHSDIMLVKDFQLTTRLRETSLDMIECILCVSKDHPLASQKDVELLDLQENIELTIFDSNEQPEFQVNQHTFGGDRVFYLAGFHSKKQALLTGLGFGWMPRYLIQEELDNHFLCEVDYLYGSRFQFVPKMVSRIEKPLGKAGQRFCEYIKQNMRAFCQPVLSSSLGKDS